MTGSRLVQALMALSMVGWVGVTGCTSGSSSTGTVAGSGETLAHQLARAYCTRPCCAGGAAAPDGDAGTVDAGGAALCPTGAPAVGPDGGVDGACVARAELAAEQQLALLSAAYSEGLISVNALVAQSCVAAYQDTACPAGGAPLDIDQALTGTPCTGLFTGYIPPGERCDMTAECVSGTYCLAQGTGQPITSLTGTGTLGVCFAYQLAGAPCNTTTDCLPPLTCSATTLLCQ
ncbi:MAG TPA: hypothetical protein VN962_28390 [Polyangia bacterium]|nr:hypothetical protein [Polyangia bacterium]